MSDLVRFTIDLDTIAGYELRMCDDMLEIWCTECDRDITSWTLPPGPMSVADVIKAIDLHELEEELG